jgi:membrane-associated protein
VPDVVEILRGLSGGEIHAALFFAALLEYVFPPFPGDLAMLFGVFLATWRGESPALVFCSTLAGALAGAAAAWRAGAWLRALEERDAPPGGWLARVRPSPERFARFAALVARHGPAVIAVNRFFPGLRAFFILAAGMAGIPFRKTMAYAAVSAALWNALLFSLGKAAGDNWERLAALLAAYSTYAVAAASAIIAAVIVLALIRRRTR